MGTRSSIVEPHQGSVRGRYCHWDGYPEHLGATIWAIVQRDGVEDARRVLLHENTYWSQLDLGAPQPIDDRFVAVEGYGIAGPGQGVHYNDWLGPIGGDGWEEWMYVIDDDALVVVPAHHAWQARIQWDEPEPNWATLATKAGAR